MQGTGKTYTIALSLLRLFDARSRLHAGHGKVVFLTAMTHAAIEACLAKLYQLVERYREIPDLSTSWLDKIKIEHVVKGNDHNPPVAEFDYVYAGTVYQVWINESILNLLITTLYYSSTILANDVHLRWTV